MTKPFDLHELLARIEANLKRTSNTSCQNDTLTYRDIEINNSLVYIKDTFNKLGYKAKINTHTTSYIN